MNHNVYIFGNLGVGYTQFPEDVTRSIFETAAKNHKSKVQISIRRTSNLVYYIYTRLLDDVMSDKYIGIAISFNGVYINDITPLFNLFDNLLISIVIGGSFIEFSDNGNIISKAVSIHSRQGEVSRIVERIADEIRHLDSRSFRNLPPENFSIAVTEQIILNHDEFPFVFDKAIKDYHIINLVRPDTADLDPLNSYSVKLKDLSDRLNSLQASYKKQSEELVIVKRQKKRTTIVTALSLFIAVVVIIFISVGANLSEQVRGLKADVHGLKVEIEEKEGVIRNQRTTIQLYTNENRQLKSDLNDARNSLRRANSKVESLNSVKLELETQLLTVKSQLSSKKSEISRMKVNLSSAEKDRDSYRRWYAEKAGECKQLQDRLASLEAQIVKLQSRRNRH